MDTIASAFDWGTFIAQLLFALILLAIISGIIWLVRKINSLSQSIHAIEKKLNSSTKHHKN